MPAHNSAVRLLGAGRTIGGRAQDCKLLHWTALAANWRYGLAVNQEHAVSRSCKVWYGRRLACQQASSLKSTQACQCPRLVQTASSCFAQHTWQCTSNPFLCLLRRTLGKPHCLAINTEPFLSALLAGLLLLLSRRRVLGRITICFALPRWHCINATSQDVNGCKQQEDANPHGPWSQGTPQHRALCRATARSFSAKSNGLASACKSPSKALCIDGGR